MEAISIDDGGAVTIRFDLADRRALERVLDGRNDATRTLWRYLRTEVTS